MFVVSNLEQTASHVTVTERHGMIIALYLTL
nr:MAG TPA: hypothetical protein [Caudoviricetes sp.]